MKTAAVLGLGDISFIHLAAIQSNPGITLAAVCDIDKSKKEKAPEGIPFYTDYKEMICQEHPDVVHICLPHYLHKPVAEEIVNMGVNVFCEKPVALNTEQADAFVELEAAHPELQIGICLQNRENESIELLKKLIDSGEYGKVTGVRGLVPWFRPKSYYDEKPWRGQWETAGGGCMINQAVHTLDLLYYLGGPITGVRASVSQLLDYGIEVEDTVAANLTFANGACGIFMATNANYKNESVQIGIQTEKAEFFITDGVLYRLETDGSKTKLAQDSRITGSKFYYGASHDRLIAKFYQSLEDGSGNYTHVKDARMSIRLIDAIQESGRTGKYVAVQNI